MPNYKNMQEIKLPPRLYAAAELVGKGTVADIGSDHAHLPIYLVQHGSSRALASDINEGPCQRARINIYAWGLHNKIKVVCRDGLCGIEDFSPDNIVIAGMGGELIVSILQKSDYPQKTGCRLVLVPHTMQNVLRKHLSESGFAIDEEKVVLDGGKYYQILSARYVGEPCFMSEAEYKLGKINLQRAAKYHSETDIEWLESVKAAALRRVNGRLKTMDDCKEQKNDRELISVIDQII